MRANSAEDVGQVGERVLSLGFARCHQRVQAGDVPARLFMSDVQKILSVKGHNFERRL
jgi:hypothetical protein